MKIVLISAYFFPESSGGTERYVFDLAEMLQNEGHHIQVISSAKDQAFITYKNIQVHFLRNDTDNLASFKNLIEKMQSDVAHFHTLTPAFDTAHMKLAKRAGYSVFFTSHIVGNTCLRGSLMRFGHTPCDGIITQKTCLDCYIANKGFSVPVAKTLGYFIRLTGSPATLANVVRLKENQLKKIDEVCDAVFVFSEWQKRTFVENGFNPEKTHIIPHAWPVQDCEEITFHPTEKKTVLTIGFAGRISPEKGLHVLIDAFLLVPKKGFELNIAGIVSVENMRYYEKLKDRTTGLSNITWTTNLHKKEMVGFMRKIDVLCIPSLLFETGPYVLFEALMQQTPVIATDIGGMKEWNAKGFPVTLFAHNNGKDLAHTLSNWESPQRKVSLPVQQVSDVTTAILKIYQQKQSAV